MAERRQERWVLVTFLVERQAPPGGVRAIQSEAVAPDQRRLQIIALIEQGITACPAQEYALLGYSQGATVTNQVLQHFAPSSAGASKIQAVVSIGNPYHLSNREGNRDEECGSSTAGASGILLGTEPYEIPEAWYDTGKVRDICFTDDQVCNGVGVGNLFSGAHLLYGFEESVQSCGAEFVVGQLSG